MNDFIVKPLKNKKAHVVSAFPKLFKSAFSNIIIIAPKLSGKTTLVYNILKEVVKKDMDIIIYSPTVYSDDSYTAIIEMLNKKKARVDLHTHFIDPETGINHIDTIIGCIDDENENNPDLNPHIKNITPISITEEKEEEEPLNTPNMEWLYNLTNCTGSTHKPVKEPVVEIVEPKKESKAKKKKPVKGERPSIVLVLDDLSSDLAKHRIMYRCMTANRHRKLMVIVSSHSCIDLEPSSYNQADYLILFPRLPINRLISMNTKIGLSDENDTNSNNKLVEKYLEATKTTSPYDFLLVAPKEKETFKRNFNTILK